jgi:hypothetical protein
MYYNYIEIGTSNFETAIDFVKDNEVALLVEPIKHYLESLPSKENVIKLNCAVSPTAQELPAKIYYIPEKVIIENKLPFHMKGCNSINDYHPLHGGFKRFVVIEDIPCLPLAKIFEQQNVEGVGQIKIDTEGCDHGIMLQLIEWLTNQPEKNWPHTVKYEICYGNIHRNLTEDEIISNKMKELGYNYEKTSSDAIFTKKLLDN